MRGLKHFYLVWQRCLYDFPRSLAAHSEPIVIDVLWGKVATKVGTFLAKSMNLYILSPMAHKLLSYRESTYLVATFKKSSNLVPTLKVWTPVPTLYVTVPTFVVRTRKVCTISSYFLKYVLIKFVYNYGLRSPITNTVCFVYKMR